MNRGDIVVAAQSGAYTGKPRPFLVVQHRATLETHGTVVVCLITSSLSGSPMIRVPIMPDTANGLQKPSEIEVDKIVTLRRAAITRIAGRADAATMLAVDQALRRWLDL